MWPRASEAHGGLLAVLTEKVLPTPAHLITVADLPGLIVTADRPVAATTPLRR